MSDKTNDPEPSAVRVTQSPVEIVRARPPEQHNEEVARLTRELEAARAYIATHLYQWRTTEIERDRLRAVLREVEWVEVLTCGDIHDVCPWCWGWKVGDGHTPDCPLKAALEGRDA